MNIIEIIKKEKKASINNLKKITGFDKKELNSILEKEIKKGTISAETLAGTTYYTLINEKKETDYGYYVRITFGAALALGIILYYIHKV